MGSRVFEISIVNGDVIDGKGGRRTKQDLGISKGRIVKLGDLKGKPAARVIDAEGFIVAPGFIDIHSHSDWTLLLNPGAESSIKQGVTTEVVGNCGYSCAPVCSRDVVLRTIPWYVRDEIEVDWVSFGDFLDKLEGHGLAVNIAHLVGHGTLRLAAMGFDAREARGGEIADMKSLLEAALDQGGAGLSLGLGYVPGRDAAKEELVSLCEVVAKRGLLCSVHIRDQDYGYLEAVEEVIDLARDSSVNFEISHITPHAGINCKTGDKALRMVQLARDEGLDVNCDAHPYLWCMLPVIPILPSWALEGGVGKTLERLSEHTTREKMKPYDKHVMFKPLYERGEWDRFVLCGSKRSPELVGKNVIEISKMLGLEPHDAVFEILLREGDGLHQVSWLVRGIDEEAQLAVLRDRNTIFGSDGMALSQHGPLSRLRLHPRCWGWTAKLLGDHVRERGLMTLEEAIHKMTAKAARKVGFKDRGVIREGKVADVVVFDPDAIQDRSTYENPNHHPSGIEYVMVNGEVVVDQGEHTGALPGRVLRFS